MTERTPPTTTVDHDSADRPRVIARYLLEVPVVIALGVSFFLGVLGLLEVAFPDSSGLGDFARSSISSGKRGSRFYVDPGSAAPVATLMDVRGDVRDKPGSSVIWSPARGGGSLGDGHAVQSYASSGAAIVFDASNSVTLGERSVIVVRRPRTDGHSFRRKARVTFFSGFLRGRLGGDGEDAVELEVASSGGIVRPRGPSASEIAIEVGPDTSSLAVYEGEVAIDWGGATTVVAEGERVAFDESTAPGQPVALPRATLLSPNEGERFTYRSAPPSVELRWKASEESDDFLVRVGREPRLASPVYEGRQAGHRLVHENLEAGDYFWQVTPYQGSLAGLPSEVGRFSVSRDGEAPDLDVDFPSAAAADAVALLTGRTEPGCQVLIGDARLRADDRGRFEHRLQLRDGYNFIVVQAVDSAGNAAFQSHTIFAAQAAPPRMP